MCVGGVANRLLDKNLEGRLFDGFPLLLPVVEPASVRDAAGLAFKLHSGVKNELLAV